MYIICICSTSGMGGPSERQHLSNLWIQKVLLVAVHATDLCLEEPR